MRSNNLLSIRGVILGANPHVVGYTALTEPFSELRISALPHHRNLAKKATRVRTTSKLTTKTNIKHDNRLSYLSIRPRVHCYRANERDVHAKSAVLRKRINVQNDSGYSKDQEAHSTMDEVPAQNIQDRTTCRKKPTPIVGSAQDSPRKPGAPTEFRLNVRINRVFTGTNKQKERTSLPAIALISRMREGSI